MCTDCGIGYFMTFDGVWSQIGESVDGEVAGDQLGHSVSLSVDGSVVAVGEYEKDCMAGDGCGRVQVYQNLEGSWTQVGQDIDGLEAGDRCGQAVAVSNDGTIVAIGAPGNDAKGNEAGHVRVFRNVDGTWTQIGPPIKGEAEGDQSGSFLALSGDGSVLAIGAEYNNDGGDGAGQVRVYENVEDVWGKVGQDIEGVATHDRLGIVVALSADGSIVAIGVPKEDSGFGEVQVYENIDGTWTLIGEEIVGQELWDGTGRAVSLSANGSKVAVGSTHMDETEGWAGTVRVFENIGGTWTQAGNLACGSEDFYMAGVSISLSADGSVLAVGVPRNEVSEKSRGQVSVYRDANGSWEPFSLAIDAKAGEAYFGAAVSLSGDGTAIAVGAPGGNQFEGISGHVRIFAAPDSEPVVACAECELDCDVCVDELTCTACVNGAFLFDSDCTMDCPGMGAFFNDGVVSPPFCTGCEDNCLACDDDFTCTDCEEGFDVADMPGWIPACSPIPGELEGELFGQTLSASGNRIAVGAHFSDTNGEDSGRVGVYEYNVDTQEWAQLGSDLVGDAAGDEFGASVSLSGDRLAVGAPSNNFIKQTAGQVRVYEYNGQAWTQLGGNLDGEVLSDEFGISVSLFGNRLAVGAQYSDTGGEAAGQVRVYEYDGQDWIQLGGAIDGPGGGSLGNAVSLTGDWLAVAARMTYSQTGVVRVYEYVDATTTWTQLGGDINGEKSGDRSGQSVSLSGDRVAIGAPLNDGNGDESGHVRVYEYDEVEETWTQLGDDLDGLAPEDWLGESVVLSGNRLAAGGTGADGKFDFTGQVLVWEYDGEQWNPLGREVNGVAVGTREGWSVAFVGDVLFAGAPGTDSDRGAVVGLGLTSDGGGAICAEQ